MSKRRNVPLFELGEYWLAVEKGREGFYRYWYEPRTRRVRRARCASETLDGAKIELAEIVIKGASESATSKRGKSPGGQGGWA